MEDRHLAHYQKMHIKMAKAVDEHKDELLDVFKKIHAAAGSDYVQVGPASESQPEDPDVEAYFETIRFLLVGHYTINFLTIAYADSGYIHGFIKELRKRANLDGEAYAYVQAQTFN